MILLPLIRVRPRARETLFAVYKLSAASVKLSGPDTNQVIT